MNTREESVFTFLLCINYCYKKIPKVLRHEILKLAHDYRFYCYILNIRLTYNLRKIFIKACKQNKYIDIIAPHLSEETKQYVYLFYWVPDRIDYSNKKFLINNSSFLNMHTKKAGPQYINLIKEIAPMLDIDAIRELLFDAECEYPYKHNIKVLEILIPLLFEAEEEEVRIYHRITDMNFISKYITEKNVLNNARLIIYNKISKYYKFIKFDDNVFSYIIKYENIELFNMFSDYLTPKNPTNILIEHKMIRKLITSKNSIFTNWFHNILIYGKYPMHRDYLFMICLEYEKLDLIQYIYNKLTMKDTDLIYYNILNEKYIIKKRTSKEHLEFIERNKPYINSIKERLLQYHYSEYKYIHYCLNNDYYDKLKEFITTKTIYKQVFKIYTGYKIKNNDFEFFHYLRTHKFGSAHEFYMYDTYVYDNLIIYDGLEEILENIFLNYQDNIATIVFFQHNRILKYYKELFIKCVSKRDIIYKQNLRNQLIKHGYEPAYVDLFIKI